MSFETDTQTLKSFVAIAETGSFSRAADAAGRTQPAISQQIKKLEDTLGCRLLTRGGKGVTLTPDGETFLSYARRIVDLHWEAYSRLREPDAEGEIRIGTPEDFATWRLSRVLAQFSKHHPRVQLSVSCDLTLNLIEAFGRGELDIILVKRDPQSVTGGVRVWREPLVFAASAQWTPTTSPLPLVLSPKPCIYRARALAALDRAGIAWRIVYTSQSLAGTLAAARAGMGATVLPANMLPADVHPLGAEAGLPELSDAEIALMQRDNLSKAGQMLIEHVIHGLEIRQD